MTVPSDRYAVRRLQSYRREQQPYSGVLLAYAQLNQDPEGAAWLAWDAILRQIPAVWVDRPINMGPHNLVAPSGRLGDGLAALARALDQIHGGPGQVLLNAIPHHTGIALADSTASRYLDYGDPEPGRTAADSEDWVEQILNQLGFNPVVRPLTASLDGFNTVVLSRARVLSDEELTILGAFHDQGGLIIADGRAGRFDIHGVERQRAPMSYLHPCSPIPKAMTFPCGRIGRSG
jgi:hypothetical protein